MNKVCVIAMSSVSTCLVRCALCIHATSLWVTTLSSVSICLFKCEYLPFQVWVSAFSSVSNYLVRCEYLPCHLRHEYLNYYVWVPTLSGVHNCLVSREYLHFQVCVTALTSLGTYLAGELSRHVRCGTAWFFFHSLFAHNGLGTSWGEEKPRLFRPPVGGMSFFFILSFC